MQQQMFQDELGDDPSVSEVLVFYRRSLRASRKTKNTVRNYGGAIERMGTFLGNPKTSAITTYGLEKLLARMRQEGLDEKTIEVTVSALKHFFRWSLERQIVKTNPAERIVFPRVDLKLPAIPTKAEFDRMLLRPAAGLSPAPAVRRGRAQAGRGGGAHVGGFRPNGSFPGGCAGPERERQENQENYAPRGGGRGVGGLREGTKGKGISFVGGGAPDQQDVPFGSRRRRSP